MADEKQKTVWVDSELIEAIRSFSLAREVVHCGGGFLVDPLEIYADCPKCGAHIKLRSFTASYEIEDLFDAVLLWMNRPEAMDVLNRRQQKLIEAEPDD
jgi:hypothetical protein